MSVSTLPDPAALVASLQAEAPGATFEAVPSVDLQTTIYVSGADVGAVARALRDRPDLRFALLAELTAVDFHPREPRFELVYLLVSIEHRRRLRLKVRLPGDAAHVSTVSGVWPAANWLEREVWDLFGIVFEGHPDPRRLLMPEDWDGFPLRKDSPVQIKMTPRASEPLQVTEQEFRANLERDRLTRG
jgi:NADH-quinone oxidoreductase subunit C